MKTALCLKDINEISLLLSNKTKTIDTYLVDREICEKPENNFLQIIPYVSFYYFNIRDGKLNLAHYLRAAKGNEDRLYSKTSIGFGGHIDNLDDIEYSGILNMENDIKRFIMNKDQLYSTAFNTAKRELKEELGVDIVKELDLEFNTENTLFFIDTEGEVNKVHICLSIPIELTEEKYDTFYKIVKINKEEIDSIGNMVISIRDIVEDMNLEVSMKKVTNELKISNNMEDWSLRVIDIIVRKILNNLLKDITYDDIIKISYEKKK